MRPVKAQNGNKSSVLHNSLKHDNYPSHSVGVLSMVPEEEPGRQNQPAKRHGKKKSSGAVGQHDPPAKKYIGKKKRPGTRLACLLYPLKKLRDMYINCCFQIAEAGDLSVLVGVGHSVPPMERFSVSLRESSDQDAERARPRRAANKFSTL